MLHGFLAYLMKCAFHGDEYTILGYKGKQVRDNIHSWDLGETDIFTTSSRSGRHQSRVSFAVVRASRLVDESDR